jgi:hypothetical protein
MQKNLKITRHILLHCKAKYFFEILEKGYLTSLQNKVFFEILEKEYVTFCKNKIFRVEIKKFFFFVEGKSHFNVKK